VNVGEQLQNLNEGVFKMTIRWSSGKFFSMNMSINYGRDIDTKFVVTIYDTPNTTVKEFDNYNDADDFYDATYERLNNRDDMIDTEGG
jgi:hypothetical protein